MSDCNMNVSNRQQTTSSKIRVCEGFETDSKMKRVLKVDEAAVDGPSTSP